MKKCFAVRVQPLSVDVTFFLLRLVIGLAFVHHGWGKIQDPFHWMGAEAKVPGLLQFLAALSEFGGGLALILGLLTRLAALGLAITMAVAASMHMFVFGDPFVASGPGQGAYEPALVYLAFAVYIMAAGPGRVSLDAMVFGRKN